MTAAIEELAGPLHAELMAALHGRCFPDAWPAGTCAELLALAGTVLLVALDGEAPVGFLLARTVSDEAEILSFGVLPERRRAGWGRRLVAAALQLVGRRGARCLFLEVAERNGAARTLYEGCGFHQVGRRARYYPDGDSALILRRDLVA